MLYPDDVCFPAKQLLQTRKEKKSKILNKWAYKADKLRRLKGDLVIRKIPLLFLKCSNIQCKNHDSGFFTSQIIENYFPYSLQKPLPPSPPIREGSIMAEAGQGGGAENTASRTKALWAARGFSCPGWVPKTCDPSEGGSVHACPRLEGWEWQRACDVALVAGRPPSRQLRENEIGGRPAAIISS